MAYASLLGGLSLANAGLGVIHGFAAPIGAMFDAPHGAICAALLPHGMAANIRAGAALKRYGIIAQLLTGSSEPEDGVAWVKNLCQDLNIQSLGTYGIRESYVSDLVEKASRASSMKGNPIPLSAAQLTQILCSAL
jgi:alcohol dehydrogenase class IV